MIDNDPIALFRPKIGRYFAMGAGSVLFALVCYYLLEDVNEGGTASLNFLAIVAGTGMGAVGLLATGVALFQLVIALTIRVEPGHAAIVSSWGKEMDRWPLSDVTKDSWGVVARGQSNYLWMDVYYLLKPNGIYFSLGPLPIFLERYQQGLASYLRTLVPDHTPTKLIRSTDGSGNRSMCLLFSDDGIVLTEGSSFERLGERPERSDVLIKLRSDDSGRLLLTVLRPCDASWTDAATGHKGEMNRGSWTFEAAQAEHDVSTAPFSVAGLTLESESIL